MIGKMKERFHKYFNFIPKNFIRHLAFFYVIDAYMSY